MGERLSMTKEGGDRGTTLLGDCLMILVSADELSQYDGAEKAAEDWESLVWDCCDVAYQSYEHDPDELFAIYSNLVDKKRFPHNPTYFIHEVDDHVFIVMNKSPREFHDALEKNMRNYARKYRTVALEHGDSQMKEFVKKYSEEDPIAELGELLKDLVEHAYEEPALEPLRKAIGFIHSALKDKK